MDRSDVVLGVQAQAEWWLDERLRKIRNEKHDSMEVNPFMAPLVSALHGHSDFTDLAGFLLGGHFSTGHATGFGKLVDEKILPRVFGTTKLDRATRRGNLFEQSCFDNIDHVVHKQNGEVLLSLKASKWTIQLGQAVELNNSFKAIHDLHEDHQHTYSQIVVGVFYGTAARLTDKYRLIRGINTGANHDLHDLRDYVSVRAGNEFWAWLGDNPDTQQWVLEGILNAIEAKRGALHTSQELIARFRDSFAQKYSEFIDPNGEIDWAGILRLTNGG